MTAASATHDAAIIEGEFRVIATRDARSSPNRRRAAARVLCWNAIFVGALLVLPHLFG